MAKILITSGLELSSNPRVVKEADVLAAAGHEVTVLSSLVIPGLAGREDGFNHRGWRNVRLLDLTDQRLRSKLEWNWRRGVHKIGRFLASRYGLQTAHSLGYFPWQIVRWCRAFPADLFICHVNQATWAGSRLLSEGRRVAFDFEDWYSRDLPERDRRLQSLELLEGAEKDALGKGAFCVTTSQVLSAALASYADTPRRPAVVYNSFPWAERFFPDTGTPDRKDRSIPSLYWFSQVTSAGRGLEELFKALYFVRLPLEIHLRGNVPPGYEEAIRALAPGHCQHRIFFHPQVPHHEMLARIAEHDIGFAGEIPFCESRNLTITNKILHYLLGGIAVVASDTEGQREVAAGNPEGILLYSSRDPESLASAINTLLENGDRLRAAGAANLELARTRFCWEISAGVLRDQVEQALAGPAL
jgi:glycosyltransferase involved in cell wall biosynthesis